MNNATGAPEYAPKWTRPRNARSFAAEAAFRKRLGELGAELLEPYAGSKMRHHVRCAAGHDCYPMPNTLQSTPYGICAVCARNDPATAEKAFLARLAELGAVPLYESWLGNQRPHRVRCINGHDCYPRPNDVTQGDGICRKCAGSDTATAEAAFLGRLKTLKATPLYETWRGTRVPHHVRCPKGHDCYPWPGSVRDGQGVCNTCAHDGEWDVFYVVTSAESVKFGITSGDPRHRLGAHSRAGYKQVVRLVTSLPGTVAADAERAVRQALAMASEKPTRGKEYFPLSCLAMILDVADSWLP